MWQRRKLLSTKVRPQFRSPLNVDTYFNLTASGLILTDDNLSHTAVHSKEISELISFDVALAHVEFTMNNWHRFLNGISGEVKPYQPGRMGEWIRQKLCSISFHSTIKSQSHSKWFIIITWSLTKRSKPSNDLIFLKTNFNLAGLFLFNQKSLLLLFRLN